MKKILIIILFITGATASYAQNFGVQAGLRINNSDIEYPGVDMSRKLGFEGGVFYESSIVKDNSWKINVAALYFNQEFNLKHQYDSNSGITYHFTENNIKVPATVKWQLISGKIIPFLRAGVYSSYSVGGKIKDSDSKESLKYEGNSDKLDYGMTFGAGVHLTSNIVLNANYDLGFADRKLALGNQYVSVKNRNCSVLLSYLF